jgi:hypothetical protein
MLDKWSSMMGYIWYKMSFNMRSMMMSNFSISMRMDMMACKSLYNVSFTFNRDVNGHGVSFLIRMTQKMKEMVCSSYDLS